MGDDLGPAVEGVGPDQAPPPLVAILSCSQLFAYAHVPLMKHLDQTPTKDINDLWIRLESLYDGNVRWKWLFSLKDVSLVCFVD